MKDTPIRCDLCGKICKNKRGLAIHRGHMHKRKDNHLNKEDFVYKVKNDKWVSKDDILAEIHSLRQLIVNLTHSLQQINYEVPSTKWKPLNNSPPKSPNSSMVNNPNIGMNYGGDHGALMNELKSVLKERIPVSA